MEGNVEVLTHGCVYEGHPENLQQYIRVCPECGCKFSYHGKDAYHKFGYDNPMMWVDCPECGYPVCHCGVTEALYENPAAANVEE